MYFIGDIHGEFKTLNYLLQKMPIDQFHNGLLSTGEICIQVGDLGIFRESDINYLNNINLNSFYALRGNHDNPEIFDNLNYSIGDYGYNEDLNMFWFAGGYSIDRQFRTQGVDWWPEEEQGYLNCNNAISIYKVKKPKIMVSHECPSIVKPYIIRNTKLNITSKTEQVLSAMLDSNKPEVWVFGHHHRHLDITIDGVRFICLNDNRGPIKELFIKI